MNKSIFYILLLTALPLYFTGCRKEVRPTSMTIKDSVRHYYPIKQGQQLDIMFTITNTGDAPLIISEMQPSCGCIILDKKFAYHHSRRRYQAIQSNLQQHQECRRSGSPHPDFRQYAPPTGEPNLNLMLT